MHATTPHTLLAPLAPVVPLLLDAITEGVLVTGADQRALYANREFLTMTGYDWGDFAGRSCRFLQGPGTSGPELDRLNAALAAGEPFRGRLLNYRKDRTTFINELSISPVRDATGAVTHFLSVQRDVSYEIGLETTLQYSRQFDAVTGIPNRVTTRAHVVSVLAKGRRTGHGTAIAVGDLPGFREVNYQYGYGAADQFLEELAFRVGTALRPDDFLGRISADEFAIVMSNLPLDREGAASAALAVLERLETVLRSPIEFGSGLSMRANLRFGLAIAPFDAAEADALLMAAETRRATNHRRTA